MNIPHRTVFSAVAKIDSMNCVHLLNDSGDNEICILSYKPMDCKKHI